MNRRIRKKLHSRSGETIAETLIALLISALALVMLAGAISAGTRIILQSENTIQAYYQENNKLATPAGSTANIEISIKLADETDVIPVQYGTNSTFGSKPVVAYVKQGKEGE